MRACDQDSIFSTGRRFYPDYELLLELHALTLVARSFALLQVGAWAGLEAGMNLIINYLYKDCKALPKRWG